ncbi:alpha/beta fold hydrolase [Psychrobacillus sp. NPDC096426]|uniref:alpha/beta fold hydrolase n=1 Tax=Psychrobacillus sp. NPDC096426 TaxID=3364491 RepID=UPI00380D7504
MIEIKTRKIQTNGYSTSLLESGNPENDTIIFLHGGGPGATAISNWKNFIPCFNEQFHVLAPDILGYGYTDHPEEMPKTLAGWMRERVNQVLAMMDELGIEKAHIAGNSMGGALTMHLLMAAPERFDRVSLMGSAGGLSSTATVEVMRMIGFYKDPTITSFKNLLKWFVYDESLIGDQLDTIVKERFEEVMRPEVRRSYESFFAVPPVDFNVPPSALRRIDHPVLIAHGREDRFVLPESSVYLQQYIPNSQLHIFDKCGHWVQVERKDSYSKLLLDFFNDEY